MKGTHLVCDFEGVEWCILDDEEGLKAILLEACKRGNLTVLSGNSWKFDPQGVTAFYILSESHISIHTTPELNKAHLDVYHCGDNGNVFVTLTYIREKLNPTSYDVTILQR
jgi:S-adenosylmethionine decarboxylase